MTALLSVEGVTCVAGDRIVVTAASFELSGGESVALVGPSGSGKTMLVMCLGGLSQPHSGTVTIHGGGLKKEPHRGGQVGVVFQTYGLLPLLTARENVEVALRCAGWEPRAARSQADDALEMVGVGSYSDHLIEELSGGQAQRVGVARAIALQPVVLIADEPTTEQDPKHRDLVLGRVFGWARAGRALLVATHDEEVANRCDRILQIHQGRVTEVDGSSAPTSRSQPETVSEVDGHGP